MDTDRYKIIDLFPLNTKGMSIETVAVLGFPQALCAMRNPMESWDRSDSYYDTTKPLCVDIGPNDMKLLKNLGENGSPHDKHLRMIHVYFNANMPRAFWQEFDTYKFNTKISDSTMHKLLNNNNPITPEMFLFSEEDTDVVTGTIQRLDSLRVLYKDIQKNCTDGAKSEKLATLIERGKNILYEGFLQFRTVDTSYGELKNIYAQRCDHRYKKAWQDTFCRWVESLPNSWMITE